MKEIEAVEQAIVEAFERKDAAAMAACYTEDAVLMPPNHPAVVGREAIEAHFREGFARFDAKLATEIEEIEVAGDWAWLRTRLRQEITPRGGKPMTFTAKALVVARRQDDGSWKYHRDIFNGDEPPRIPSPLGCLAGFFGRRG